MKETSKAMRRRRCEDASGSPFWSNILRGIGIDVGAGDDPLQLPLCKPFDVAHGDANLLHKYFLKESMDYIHASQSLEHMHDPLAALLNWAVILKPGGHIVFTVPDFDLYEACVWPSRFNPDHKSAWSLWRKDHHSCPVLRYVPEFLRTLERNYLETKLARLVDTNFDWKLSPSIDQTFPEDGAECFIEVVLQKKAPR